MADRLISADALDKALTALRFNADGELAHWGDRKDWCLHGSEVEKLIADAPTVDAVEVVRCKDCRWHEDEEPGMVWCSHIVSSWMEEDEYCSMGKRMDEVEG